MYDQKSRIRKAQRIVKLLKHFFQTTNLSAYKVLDIGASTGIIDNYLARHFNKVVGIDIDQPAIKYAQKTYRKTKGLTFKVDDAMKLSFSNQSFDIVICTHIYEHVPNASKMFSEVSRVLKPNGICYLAAINALWPIEPHYNLPLLSYLPKALASRYLNLFKHHSYYYENPKTYWGLKRLTNSFKVVDYTAKILRSPDKYAFNDKITGWKKPLLYFLSPLATYFSPTFFWLLVKK